MTELKFENMTAAASGDSQNMLGKLLYFSLPSVLVDKDDLRQLCVDMNIPYAGGNRLSVSDAFRSATGDVRDRIISEEYGERRIYQIYCRDNRRISDSVISRELVKETMHQETNQYEKLANISYDKDSQIFSYDNLAYDSQIDAMAYCRRAEELFELYQRCANRRQVETICVNFLRMLESTKLSVNGHLYFVPRHNMEKVDIFEDFVAELSRLSRNQTHLMANSIYIIDDAKQRQKMTEEFYSAVKGLENEPEKGARCTVCYRLRLEQAARYAAAHGFDWYCTTLSISPMKDPVRLNDLGTALGQQYDVAYLPSEFRKKDGYKRSLQLSAEYGLYRQDYCGCVFSKQEREAQAHTL